MEKNFISILLVIISLWPLNACQVTSAGSATATLKVLAVASFLGDIAQNVAGSRLKVETLIPIGLDPHAFEPTPRDVARIADSTVLILNGAGFESWIAPILESAGGKRLVIEASKGLKSRPVETSGSSDSHGDLDPHFWLDPTLVIRYTENIRDGLTQADPQGAALYQKNTSDYSTRLRELDGWIQDQVQAIPLGHKVLVTNHESLGYFADRYGFKIVGAVVPSVSSGSSPSARQLSELVRQINSSGAPAIFLETGDNPQLARQIAAETGIAVVTDLNFHSVTEPDGPTPGYIELMRFNVRKIVGALK